MVDSALESIPAELKDIAWEWRDRDFSWNDKEAPKPTGNLLEAIYAIMVADEKDFEQPYNRERDVKLAKYTLLEHHLKLLDKVVCKENLSSLVVEQNRAFSSVEELKSILKESGRKIADK